MSELQLGLIEAKFADLIWSHAPVSTSELVRLAEHTFGWKRTTTHTVVKRLCDKGLFEKTGGLVTPCMSRAEFYARQSRKYVDDSFDGSLPAFLAAFTSGRRLSAKDAAELRAMISRAEELP